ncbi:TlpA family protein disulfide reductase [Flexithrix dorotheae]|uniref:TlpA family protein disulfide reductase n=1 Tax=Flexithrix dorotheae TaxID=70993 RepID=UPI00037E4DEB|nr:thioredoxin fold domain-containing protein [Flexithrix dorotheae]
MTKYVVVIAILISISFCIVFLFWNQELQYSRPTPVPQNHIDIPVLSKVNFEGKFDDQSGKVKLLHFFNPSCPCSRFNTKHVSYLMDTYKEDVNFTVVVPFGSDEEAVKEFFGNSIEILIDNEEKELAKSCGVYSTPQAVILDQKNTLYYRGNYNKSRYCTLPQSNYAEIAINQLLNGLPPSNFENWATQAYGCQYSKKNDLTLFSAFLKFN